MSKRQYCTFDINISSSEREEQYTVYLFNRKKKINNIETKINAHVSFHSRNAYWSECDHLFQRFFKSVQLTNGFKYKREPQPYYYLSKYWRLSRETLMLTQRF